MFVLFTMETTFSTPELQLFHQLFDYYSSDSSTEYDDDDEDDDEDEYKDSSSDSSGYDSPASVLSFESEDTISENNWPY